MFCGLLRYYARYIPNMALLAAPLTDLTKGHPWIGKIVWTEDCQIAFEKLKYIITSEPVLKAPKSDQQFMIPLKLE